MSAALLSAPASAQSTRPSLEDSFRLGSGAGILCRVQNNSADAAIEGMFDRAWTIVCRDAARPVGQLYQLRAGEDALPRIAKGRTEKISCAAPVAQTIEGLGNVSVSNCSVAGGDVGYRIYEVAKGDTRWLAQGLAGYDSALTLGLRTVIADRIVPGDIAVATTGVSDPQAFARVQAGTLDPRQALGEGYRRNNSGDYAEAAAFFDILEQRLTAEAGMAGSGAARDELRHEYAVNRALQKSNLGEFAEANRLFAEAARIPTLDRVQMRLRRNFEALNLINQRRFDDALAVLERSVSTLGNIEPDTAGGVELSPQLAAEINSAAAGQRLGVRQSTSLTPAERGAILDAQAMQLRGTILRMQGKPAEARALLVRAMADVDAIRGGRVSSITRLRAQIMAERGLAHEQEGDLGAAEGQLSAALQLIAAQYPETSAVNGARARLGAFFARRGKAEQAIALYREVVQSSAGNPAATTGLSNQLSPYFTLLAAQIPSRPELVEDMFLATQALVRPGVADTQAVLARELSDGGGEASRLFRQSVTLTRDIERTRIALAQAQDATEAETSGRAVSLKEELDALIQQQAQTQAQLSGYSQYRALSTDVLTLADLRAALKPGEAYYKLAVSGDAIYAVWADAEGATGYRLPLSVRDLEGRVRGLRETISVEENGQQVTYPFDVKGARQLYRDLFAPVDARLKAAQHLVFEPDGAMLQLPANLLIADDNGIDAYLKRADAPDGDPFDMRGITWLGRSHAVSTAVSARSFREARQMPASRAGRQYMGFGQNAPISATEQFVSASRGSLGGAAGEGCDWPLTEWNKPIADRELRQTAAILGNTQSLIVTGGAFTDSDIRARQDLSDYRILHFATHGLVTAPRPECAARPALLTSFGDGNSDGLLSFSEIYDLKIDADLVILSACDTAGKASLAATREAGVTTGGGSALDGLVRAFIGAGGRSVVASHWPAPDDFNATEKLISGLFQTGAGDSVGAAMQHAASALMDKAETSHPYYWSGFAIVGDGARPLITAR
ncbi:CHAT domain-containing protein [Sphingomonas sp. C3-2]|nr:CHAT domain-containing protein [Sphingomonas sp. C3-2]